MRASRATTGSPRRIRPVRIAIAGVVIALIAGGVAYTAASYVVYDRLSTVGECDANDQLNTPAAFTVPDPVSGHRVAIDADHRMPSFEDVRIDNVADGLSLAAWWVPAARDDAPAVVLVHGYSSCRKDPNILLPAAMLARDGFSVLLVDQRNHGDSEDVDRRFAGGTKEFRDVLAARDWLTKVHRVPAERIGLLGMSMGTGSVLIAAASEPSVAAVWADSMWTTPLEGIRAYLTERGYPPILAEGGIAMAWLVSRDDLLSRTPLEAVRAFHGRPLSLVQGTDDWLPPRFAQELHDAAVATGTPADLWIVDGATHTGSVFLETDEYERRLDRFFERALEAPDA